MKMEEKIEDSNLENSSSSSSSLQNQTSEQIKSMKVFPIFSKNFRPKMDPLRAVQLELDKSTPTKRKRTKLAKESDGMSQMVLDAGQKELGPRFCEECGLLYSPGDFEDEEEHRKAHLRILNTFTLTLWKDARILFTYPDGCVILLVQCNSDSKRVLNKLKDFLAWLDSELGAGYEPSGHNDQRIFLYAARTKRANVVRILGCGITEIPDVLRTNVSSLVGGGIEEKEEEEEEEEKKRKIMIGVTRLWTDAGFRRKQIASKLLEMMRFNSGIPGCVVPKNKLGILEPSDEGKAFMNKFTQGTGAIYTYHA